jgi:hypothetical protein
VPITAESMGRTQTFQPLSRLNATFLWFETDEGEGSGMSKRDMRKEQKTVLMKYYCWSRWPRCIWCGYAVSRLLGLRGRIPLKAGMSASFECCVLSGTGLCVGLITHLEESYRVWCVWVWSSSLDNEQALAHWGLLRHEYNEMMNIAQNPFSRPIFKIHKVYYNHTTPRDVPEERKYQEFCWLV